MHIAHAENSPASTKQHYFIMTSGEIIITVEFNEFEDHTEKRTLDVN